MTFQKYIESSKVYVEDKDKTYHTLKLVADTATLIEKVKYFRSESALIMADIGDIFFRLFALLDKYNLAFDAEPFDLEAMKMKTDQLDNLYSISEENLLQNYMMEIGVLSSILTENMKYSVDELTDEDLARAKKSIYAFSVQLLILVCKMNFSIDKVLDFSINKLKAESKKLNAKTKEVKEDIEAPTPMPVAMPPVETEDKEEKEA